MKVSMKEAIRFWDELGFYIWCQHWKRANNVCEKLDEIKKNSPLKYYIGYILSRLVTV